MTLPGHTIFALLLFVLLQLSLFPFGWIVLVISHFILDRYPDFWSKDYKKEIKLNLLFGLGVIFNYALIIIIALYFMKLSVMTFFWITLFAMFPDITEGIYLAIKFLLKKQEEWPDKFWFNHDGFFPYKQNNWQIASKNFKCLSRKMTVILDFVFIIIIGICLIVFLKK